MQIKYQELNRHLQQGTASIYCLAGQDAFVMLDARQRIIQHFKKERHCDHVHLQPNNLSDWTDAIQQACNMGLFCDAMVVDILHSKSSLDKQIKTLLTDYLEKPANHSLIMIRAPELNAQAFKWLDKLNHAVFIPCYPLAQAEHLRWLQQALSQNNLSMSRDLQQQVIEHTDGNMLATDQLIQRLSLCYPEGADLTDQQVMEQLLVQSEHQIYDLSEAYLQGNAKRALHILRRIQHTGDQRLLILWLLSQDIQQLIRLLRLMNTMRFSDAARQCGIWTQKKPAWQAAVQRLTLAEAEQLLEQCHHLDVSIKSQPSFFSELALERLILHLATGQSMEQAC